MTNQKVTAGKTPDKKQVEHEVSKDETTINEVTAAKLLVPDK